MGGAGSRDASEGREERVSQKGWDRGGGRCNGGRKEGGRYTPLYRDSIRHEERVTAVHEAGNKAQTTLLFGGDSLLNHFLSF